MLFLRYLMRLAKLLFLIILCLNQLILMAQNRKYKELIPEIRYHSYFDSATLFQKGTEAIEIAKEEGHPEFEAEIIIFYGNHFYYKTEVAKAKSYYKKASALASKFNNNKFKNLSKIRLTYLLWDGGETEKAENIFYEILKNAKKNKEYSNQIECYNALALIYSYQNKFKECMSFYLKGLKIAEENNDNHYTPVLLNNIGLLKFNNKQYEEALKDFERGVKLAELNNDTRLTFHLYNNMALIYSEQGKVEEAKNQYEKILKYAHKSGNPRELAIAAINLSNLYSQEENFEIAHQYSDTALITFKNNQYSYELAKGYLGKAQIYLKQKKFNDALIYTNLAKQQVENTNDLEDAIGIHITMSRIYEAKGNSSAALVEYKSYKKLNDSLNDLRNTKEITEIQAKYNDEKKDADIEKERNRNLELENKNLTLERNNIEEKEKAERKMIFGIVIAISIILFIFIYFYASYNKKTRLNQQRFSQQLIHDIEEERNRIAKDLHDDIGQSLSAIKSKLNLIHQKEIDSSQLSGVENEVGKVIEQTRDISRKLYPAYLEKIGLTRSVARLMDGIQDSTDIVCSFEIDPEIDELSMPVLTHIYRIIQECVNNTMKHANASALKVTVLKKDDFFQLIYQDNGKGIQKSENKLSGIGFMSLKERSRMIKGELNISDNAGKGFRLIINFNKSIA
jgi:two-component system NarL family sensor kinase